MSENNSIKKANNKAVSPLSINSINNISANQILASNNISINSNNEQPGIIEVYEDNFIEEIKNLGSLLEEYNYIGMDTEYPGIIFVTQNLTKDFYYKTLKMNVDSLKIIQLGITLTNSKGEYPKNSKYHTWQLKIQIK